MVTPMIVAVALQAYDNAVGMVTVPDLRSRFAAMQKALEAADEAQQRARLDAAESHGG